MRGKREWANRSHTTLALSSLLPEPEISTTILAPTTPNLPQTECTHHSNFFDLSHPKIDIQRPPFHAV
jgi:hypothetical protein